MSDKPKREWNIREQARLAKASFDARPAWVKRISYFAGTNNVPVDDSARVERNQEEGK